MSDSAEQIIELLNLSPHPEGGYYRETYRSGLVLDENVLPDRFVGNRHCATCIYFLLTNRNFSAFHRINQDEIWHFYAGQPLTLHIIDLNGEYLHIKIGMDLQKGVLPQFVVPAGSWFAAEIEEKDGYALVGCTVAPGFDFRDFELGDRKELCDLFPQHNQQISRLTRH